LSDRTLASTKHLGENDQKLAISAVHVKRAAEKLKTTIEIYEHLILVRNHQKMTIPAVGFQARGR
jgi:hypothetical protein